VNILNSREGVVTQLGGWVRRYHLFIIKVQRVTNG